MSRLEKDLSNSCKVLRVDVNSSVGKHVWDEYNVRSVPTFILINNKKAVWRTEGNIPNPNTITQMLVKSE